MKPFSLNTVLKYRKQMVDVAINRLAVEEQKKTSIVKELDEKNVYYYSLITTLDRLQTTGIGVDQLILFEDRLQFIKGEIEQLKEKLEKAKKLVRKARSHVLLKAKEKKALEKLRDNQNLAWKKHLEKKETTQMDEIATLRHERK